MPEPLPKPTARTAASGAALHRAIGTIHPDTIPIFLHEEVLEQILDYSERDLSRELGGFLVGRFHAKPPPRVEIRHFLPALDTRSRISSLTFTHDTWAAMTRKVDREFPEEQVVGWQHTHPGFGVFLSGHDMFIHRHFFDQPWQVAMVVDPRRGEMGFFQWQGDEVVDCGFVCVSEL